MNGKESFDREIGDPSVKVVSFDVFDTLLVRPFWRPADMFSLMWEDFRKRRGCEFEIDYQRLRVEAESMARGTAPTPEVTLDDIYAALTRITGWDKSFVDGLKSEEVRCELAFCRARKSALGLVSRARSCGKRVIAVSDMYLPREAVAELLARNGFAFSDGDVFVSCEHGKSKATGELFSFVATSLAVPPESILHVGDNLASDVTSARKRGLRALHFPKPVELMRSALGEDGHTLERIFSRAMGCADGLDATRFLGIRCRLALAANRLFDDPFSRRTRSGAFGGDVEVLGYFALGMHLLAVAEWINERLHALNLTGIHFLARDGHLPRLAYERLHNGAPEIPCDTWHLNRAFTIALRLQTKDDFLEWLERANVGGSFAAVFAAFRALLCDDSFARAKELLQSEFDTDRTIDECGRLQVIAFCRDVVFPQYEAEIHASQNAIRDYLKGRAFGNRDATFDIGYACRMESSLARVGIRTTTMYIHLKGGGSLERSGRHGLGVQTFYDYTQSATGLVRELLFSSADGKCTRYGTVAGVFGPVFEEQAHGDRIGRRIVQEIQDSALAFVDDWCATFGVRTRGGGGYDSLAVRRVDASLPYDYFLTYAPSRDYDFLKDFYFDDVQGAWNVSLQSAWNMETFATYAAQSRNLQFLKRCEGQWSDECASRLGMVRAYGIKRISRLGQVAHQAMRRLRSHPASCWCALLPYWFLRRRDGDVYASAFRRLPLSVRCCLPAGFMRLWSEQIDKDEIHA